MELPAGQAVFARNGDRDLAGCWNRAEQTGKPLRPVPRAACFSVAGIPVMLNSFSFGVNECNTHDGGARNLIHCRTGKIDHPCTKSELPACLQALFSQRFAG
jgi:hypothetical protein